MEEIENLRKELDALSDRLQEMQSILPGQILKDQARDENGRFAGGGGGGGDSQHDSRLSVMVGRGDPGNKAFQGPMLAQHLKEGDVVHGEVTHEGVRYNPFGDKHVTSVEQRSDGTLTAQHNKPDGSYGGSTNFSTEDVIHVSRSAR